MLASVAGRTCQTCFKKDHCWSYNSDKTYDALVHVMTELQDNDLMLSNRTERAWERHCARSKSHRCDAKGTLLSRSSEEV